MTDNSHGTRIQYRKLGGPEVLESVDFDVPQPGDGQYVVRVAAAGVNPIDWKLRSGFRDGGELNEPVVPGFDGAGTVVAAGPGAIGFHVGDDVGIRQAPGTYTTHVVVSDDALFPKAAQLSFEQVAALGIPVATAYQALRSLGVNEDGTLLVHAGSGGVGQAAIQFALDWGAQVIATASPANHDRLRELGAVPVAYGPGLLERVREVAPDGVDWSFDAAGTDEALEVSQQLVSDTSRIGTVVAGAKWHSLGLPAWSGGSPEPLTDDQQRLRSESAAAVNELIGRGGFEVEVSRSYPLAEAAAAQAESENGHVRGKIVLIP